MHVLGATEAFTYCLPAHASSSQTGFADPSTMRMHNYRRNQMNHPYESYSRCNQNAQHREARCDNIIPLRSSASDDDPSVLENTSNLNSVGGDDDKMARKIVGRKSRVQNGYKIITIGFALFVLFSTSPINAFHVAAGMSLPAGIAYILKGAAKNDRLSSDTYKRLNLALGCYGFFGLFAKSAFKARIVRTLWGFVCSVAVVNSVKGYGYGLKGWALSDKVNPFSELADGVKSYIATLVKPLKDWKACGYLLATLSVGYMKLMMLSKVITSSLSGGSEHLAVRYILQYIRLMLLSTLTFTLKDAADRDRLTGTTFIEANALVAFASTSLAGKNLQ